MLSVQPPFIQSFFVYEGNTDCGNVCEEKIYGCLDTLAFNYIDSANTSDDCFYYPGCISPAYLEYHVDTANAYYTDINIQDSCETLAMFGCTDSLAFNYDSLANVDNGGCLPVVTGCMQPVAFNYNPLANVPDTCIPVIFGCTNVTALNYDSLANTDDGSCIAIIFGCTDPQAFNYQPQANVDDGSCVAKVFGCTDATMFNYDPLANVDNGSCIPFTYGCTDSTAFNYNPLANADNNSCIPYIYGCTDPSALNYNHRQTRRILVVLLMFMGVWIVWLLTTIHWLTRITVRVSLSLWVAWINRHITLMQMLILTILYLVVIVQVVLLAIVYPIG